MHADSEAECQHPHTALMPPIVRGTRKVATLREFRAGPMGTRAEECVMVRQQSRVSARHAQ
jgi:hypothetical protein